MTGARSARRDVSTAPGRALGLAWHRGRYCAFALAGELPSRLSSALTCALMPSVARSIGAATARP
jgi:hypothetical protein